MTTRIDLKPLEQRSNPLRRAWRRYRKNHMAVVGLMVCCILVLVAVCAPLIAPYSYEATDYENILVGLGSPGHLFGTDQLGRDMLSRTIYGLRTALFVSVCAELLALLVAVTVGLIAGYRGGRAEQLLMSLTDIMYAFPVYLFAIVLIAVFGRSIGALIVAIAIAGWVTQARLIRAQVLSIKERDYVQAARVMGASGYTIALRYILPNAVGPILVATSFAIPAAIAMESGLGLLGLGVAPPTPSWGSMIAEGTRYLLSAPHMLVAPASIFALSLLAFTWIGDGLRDAFDVRGDER